MFRFLVRWALPQEPSLFWISSRKVTPRTIAPSSSADDGGVIGPGLGPVVAKFVAGSWLKAVGASTRAIANAKTIPQELEEKRRLSISGV